MAPTVMDMESRTRTLPDFDNPPVTETLLDVAFAPLADWRIPHFGLFWHFIRENYPIAEDQPPIVLQRERLKQAVTMPRFAIEILQQPEARCWFVSSSKARLIQVQ